MLAVILLSVMTGCHGLKMGVGLRGEMLDDDMMTLDGDTFVIRGRIGGKMFIVHHYKHPDDTEPYYLLRQGHNGFYYPQIKATDMFYIDNTADFISIDGRDVYDIKNERTLFTSPCQVEGLNYIGKWKDKLLFATLDTICFSDGKCLGLRKNVYYQASKNKDMITLIDGAQKINVSFAELYNATKTKETGKNTTSERLNLDYFIKPRNDYDNVEAGFRADLDVPKGNTKAEQCIRQWMMGDIVDDAFCLLEKEILTPNCRTFEEMKASLDEYGALWEKLCRAEYQVGDTLMVRLFCDIKVDKVADCDDYVTYHYWASLYSGGLHELPHSYYITYDKRRECLLDVSNSVKPNSMLPFRKMVLKSLKAQYNQCHSKRYSWDEFTRSIFSFHCPSINTSGMDSVAKTLLEHIYTCDEWAGWNGYYEEPFTERDIPLTHMAVLPEGIVVTYHPYQIDCFMAGEYNAIVPFKNAAPCLMFDYSKHENLKPRLSQFVICKEK